MDVNSQKIKERTVLTSIAVNIFLVMNKAIFGAMSNTPLLFLDAVHSGVDMLSSLMAYASIRVSRMGSKDESRMYMQAENLASILISFLILLGAWKVLQMALEPQLLFKDSLPNFWLAILGTLISICVLYIISRYKMHMGGKVRSHAILADGYDSWMDMYSSLAVLVSLLGSLVGVSLNKIVGVLIALLIAKEGVAVLFRSARLFLKGIYSEMEEVDDMKTEVEYARIDIKKYIQRVKSIWKYMFAAILLVYLLSGIYVVESDEHGIVKRFGEAVEKDIGPGLHYRLPWPVETVLKTKVTQVNRLEIGFRLEKKAYDSAMQPELWESSHGTGSYEKVPKESMIVSGDENIVDINLIVQYRISDQSKFLFNSREPNRVVKDVVEASVRQVIGNKSIDEALTGGKLEIQGEVEDMVQETLDSYDVGVDILAVQLQDVHPPTEVAQAFKDVASAREDKDKIINDALAYKNDVLPKARGNADKIMREAEAYKAMRINKANGDVDRFMKLYGQYVKHKNITKTRIYIETLEKVLPKTRLYVIDPSTSSGRGIDYSSLTMLKELNLKNEQGVVGDSKSQNSVEEDYGYDEGYYLDEGEMFRKTELGPTLL
ncbi:MAG: FtsH protease activity modulator HflK [Candidatus Altiarchaeota archaeon]|nr:FtsH protease activity modulator HflK [Candidatus Altiarchaeota archaeon]